MEKQEVVERIEKLLALADQEAGPELTYRELAQQIVGVVSVERFSDDVSQEVVVSVDARL